MALSINGLAPLLSVFDMPTSLAFYRKLGFAVVQDSGQGDDSGWVMLELNSVRVMLNTQFEDDDRPSEPPADRTKWHDDTCLYFGCPDVDAAYAYLGESGIAANAPEIAPYGMKQLYVSDPDNYNLCFQWPSQ